ncbi:MAG: hypothetical protein LUQ38_02070 [Methanotrichaceae archaeon]|nr:hypothetical protein [Methanotrichaceae archaeon]
MKNLIAICFISLACLLFGYYIYTSMYINEPIKNDSINISIEPIEDTGIRIEKYSERQDGSRLITIYKSLDDKIWVTVIKSYNQSDINAIGLTKEIKRLVYAPFEHQWDTPQPTHYVDNRTAISTRLIEVDRKSGLPTYRVPDKYITAIGYPEKNMILLVMSNGNNVTWNIQKEMVNRFKF